MAGTARWCWARAPAPCSGASAACSCAKDRPKKAEEVRRSLQRAVDLPPVEARLFDALRAERSRLARQQGVPPYVIFHDTTLRAMAQARPRTRAQMIDLPGVGKTKLDRYGEAFLAVVATDGG